MKQLLFFSLAVSLSIPMLGQGNSQWVFDQVIKQREIKKHEIPFTHKERSVNDLFNISVHAQKDALFAEPFSMPRHLAKINDFKKTSLEQTV